MATFSTNVLASTDDARNIDGNGTYSATAQTQHLGKFNTTVIYWNGFRWNSVTIPQGATINSATITLYCAAVNGGSTALTRWRGELVANPATFGTGSDRPEDRIEANPTTAFTDKTFSTSNWTSAGFNTGDKVDVTSIIQEIVNQGSWASGNSIVIGATDNGSANTNYIGHSTYDRATDRGALLDIDYTEASGSVVRLLGLMGVGT